jgi:hypothetical protein
MTDSEFLSFIRECTLSNEDIGKHLGINWSIVRTWRAGTGFPGHFITRETVVRELTMLEHTRLSEQIQEYHARRFPGR